MCPRFDSWWYHLKINHLQRCRWLNCLGSGTQFRHNFDDYAFVVQRIERRFPKPQIRVRFPARVQEATENSVASFIVVVSAYSFRPYLPMISARCRRSASIRATNSVRLYLIGEFGFVPNRLPSIFPRGAICLSTQPRPNSRYSARFVTRSAAGCWRLMIAQAISGANRIATRWKSFNSSIMPITHYLFMIRPVSSALISLLTISASCISLSTAS